MSEEKIKEESYKNFGGINSKVSPYATGREEFRNIVNLDFQIPGALAQRQGSTQMMIGGVSGRITGIFEHTNLSGASYIVLGANTRTYYLSASSPVTLQDGLSDSKLFSFETFVDRLFVANGANFFKWKGGATPFLFSLPDPSAGDQFYNRLSASAYGSDATLTWGSATISVSWGWINERGFRGRASAANYVQTTNSSGSQIASIGLAIIGVPNGITSIIGATTNGVTQYILPLPDGNATFGTVGYTITYGVGSTFGYSQIGSLTDYNVVSGDDFTPRLHGAACYVGLPGQPRTLLRYVPFSSTNGVTYLGHFYPPGGIPRWCFQISPASAQADPTIFEPTVSHFTLFPRWLEIFNNQLFMAGFSQTPSTVWFSEIGEPESVEPTYNFEVRTNDGDRVSGLINYLSQLFIFKERTFHALSGNTIDNFQVRQISDQFGCISGRALLAYENNLLFLDSKGIALYNGANVSIISNKIENVFLKMNLTAAKDNAVMINNRSRNQIWVGLPINGATFNNVTAVFDYLTDAWTVYEGFNPSSMATAYYNFGVQTPIYGSYATGTIHNFGSSFTSDNGTGFTTLALTRFVTNQGESVQSQFRRLYVDMNPIVGATSTVSVKLFQDFGSSVVLGTTMPITQFQSRIDFGISARTLSAEIAHFSTIDQFVMHGFALASRFQRNV